MMSTKGSPIETCTHMSHTRRESSGIRNCLTRCSIDISLWTLVGVSKQLGSCKAAGNWRQSFTEQPFTCLVACLFHARAQSWLHSRPSRNCSDSGVWCYGSFFHLFILEFYESYGRFDRRPRPQGQGIAKSEAGARAGPFGWNAWFLNPGLLGTLWFWVQAFNLLHMYQIASDTIYSLFSWFYRQLHLLLFRLLPGQEPFRTLTGAQLDAGGVV